MTEKISLDPFPIHKLMRNLGFYKRGKDGWISYLHAEGRYGTQAYQVRDGLTDKPIRFVHAE